MRRTSEQRTWSRRDVLRAGGSLAAAALVAPLAPAFADAPAPSAAPATGKLTPEQRKQLQAAKCVYISSTRKDGTLGKPAEVWFALMDDAVWVGSSPKSWRVKRIRWGRPQAKIAIGSPQGPSFRATGEIVQDPALYAKFCDQLAVKYPEAWSRWERSFREGLASGERVLIRYTPVAS